MNSDPLLEQLLRWRYDEAQREAPPAPRASRLLARAQPWWETWPERSRQLFQRLQGMEFAYGHAAVSETPSRRGHPVPALLLQNSGETEISVRVLYFALRDGRLRLRLQIEGPSTFSAQALDVTFVGTDSMPLFVAAADSVESGEYRLEAVLPDELADTWSGLKVTDPMPFRFVLGPVATEN